MTLADAFGPEERVTLRYSDFYRALKTAARAEVIQEIALVEGNPAKSGAIIKKLAEHAAMEERWKE